MEKRGELMADHRALIDELTQMLSSGKSQRIDLAEFMQHCRTLFEECGESLEKGSAREKEELLKQLIALQQTLDSDVESLSKNTGKSLEQMLSYVENPDNFSQETWQTMQKTWRRITTLKISKKGKCS